MQLGKKFHVTLKNFEVRFKQSIQYLIYDIIPQSTKSNSCEVKKMNQYREQIHENIMKRAGTGCAPDQTQTYILNNPVEKPTLKVKSRNEGPYSKFQYWKEGERD